MPASERPSSSARIVVCPTCKGDSVFAQSNPHRPFCGERCRQIDLGAWADEGFRLPAAPEPDDNDAPGPLSRLQ